MKKHFIVLLILAVSVELLNAQKVQQPGNPVITEIVPVSRRVNYSGAGRDSLRVELINVDVPGLEIISCENCTVTSSWMTGQPGTLDVTVKNRGAVKSNTATVWVEYGVFAVNAYGGFKKVMASDRKGVPVLDPGKTVKLTFTINSTPGDYFMKNLVKGVRVSLTQNEGKAWRGNN
jgi:VCBS repeat-containing protein